MGKEKVILRCVDSSIPSDIVRIIKEGIQEFNLASKCKGQITIKPNVVMAHHKITPAAFTRSALPHSNFIKAIPKFIKK